MLAENVGLEKFIGGVKARGLGERIGQAIRGNHVVNSQPKLLTKMRGIAEERRQLLRIRNGVLSPGLGKARLGVVVQVASSVGFGLVNVTRTMHPRILLQLALV